MKTITCGNVIINTVEKGGDVLEIIIDGKNFAFNGWKFHVDTVPNIADRTLAMKHAGWDETFGLLIAADANLAESLIVALTDPAQFARAVLLGGNTVSSYKALCPPLIISFVTDGSRLERFVGNKERILFTLRAISSADHLDFNPFEGQDMINFDYMTMTDFTIASKAFAQFIKHIYGTNTVISEELLASEDFIYNAPIEHAHMTHTNAMTDYLTSNGVNLLSTRTNY